MKHIFAAGMSALLLAATVAGCSSGTKDSSGTKQTLTLGAIVDVASFDPSQSDVGNYMQYLQPAYDTLIKIDSSNQLQPMLATKWTYTDGTKTKLELTIRGDVKFSDGTAMDADAVVKSLERFKAANGPRSSALQNVESITAPDKTTVDITLSSPDPALVHNLGLVAGMITNPAAAATDLKSTPAGTGPYVLDTKKTNRGNVYAFVRNQHYYDTAAFPFNEIDIRVMTDPTARLNAVKTGEVDAAFALASQTSTAKGSGLTVLSNPGDWQGLFLNDRDGKIVKAMSDVRVRQAINYAIDGDAILKAYAFGHGSPSTQIFYPGTPAYDDSLNSKYPYDPAKAKQLLADAGYAGGFTLTMPSSTAFFGSVYPILQEQLAAVGIKVVYKNEPASAGLTPYLSQEYPAYMFSWGSSDNWLDASLLLAKNGAWNTLHAGDATIESLMKQIATASGSAQDALYKQLSGYVVDQAWFVPFYVADNIYISSTSVKVVAQPEQSVPSIYNYSPAT
ncbi:peptide ABC transporter substrate-binding protein [Acrocarpospora pleiomorpha]|uniref:Peptide ABC transporter substrate-binding protein n=1 Tax=Acrocarpospora pleiomorpha TaxID=90975 RepID=A0A5M3XNR8_9ACTN|nr:ABC transporter substrate-binding protein [Acrocarpospora pleiomorpha]GES22580.1 peptide ABC transporter substrate-binding protein [Acrocarpospora pleiomorpha]